MKAVAFAPAHISGFFEPVYWQKDYSRSGSRGAGINLNLGAKSEIFVSSSSEQSIDVSINNKKSNAPVTKLAIKNIIGNSQLLVKVNTKLDLPRGQGFGMSGAGALSSVLALSKLLQMPKEVAMKAAHFAEVALKTGLGDVLASSFGGIEIRREAGLPPWGFIEHIPGNYEIVVCVIGKKIETKKMLINSNKINEISSIGKYCIKKLLEKPSVENFFYLSQLFTKKTGLASEKVENAIDQANKLGMASMCMLGNSVFAFGKTQELARVLSNFGKVFVCNIDEYGARVLNANK